MKRDRVFYTTITEGYDVKLFTSIDALMKHIEEELGYDSAYIISHRVHGKIVVDKVGLLTVFREETVVRVFESLEHEEWFYRIQMHRK